MKSSWLAERYNRKLRQSAHRSVTELEADIRKWINEWKQTRSRSSGPSQLTASSRCLRITANESSTQDTRCTPFA